MNKVIVVALSIILMAGCSDAKKGGMPPGGFPVNVVAKPASFERIEDQISLVGSLVADESIEVKNEVSGVIERIGFDEGQPIKKGQMLIMIDATKLNAQQAQAEASLNFAQLTYDRLAALIESKAVSQQEFDQAKSDLESKKAQLDLIRAQLKETVITASFDGITGERKVSVGQFVNQGTILTYLFNVNPIKAEFSVPERFLGQLQEGQSIKVSVAAYPNEYFDGKVYFINPQVDDQTRSALVKAKIPNPDNVLKSGMFANLNLIINVRDQALVIPETAVIARGEETFVFVIDQENKAQMKTVKIGIRMAGKCEVIEGLSSGDMVITEGFQKIGPGSLVNPNANQQI